MPCKNPSVITTEGFVTFAYLFEVGILFRYSSPFFLRYSMNTRQIAICITVEQGVAKPILKSDTGVILLIMNDTGTLTPKAPIIPWTMTNLV